MTLQLPRAFDRSTTAAWTICGALFGSFCADEREVEGRAVLAFSLAIGYHFIAADRGEGNRGDALELAVQQLLA